MNFRNISTGVVGILESSSDSMLGMMKELSIDNSTQKAIIKKIMNIAVRFTYYVFCRRNKAWTNPELLNFQLNFTCFLSQLIFFFVFSSAYIRLFIVYYFNTIVLFLYADIRIIHYLFISEMCNYKLLIVHE